MFAKTFKTALSQKKLQSGLLAFYNFRNVFRVNLIALIDMYFETYFLHLGE